MPSNSDSRSSLPVFPLLAAAFLALLMLVFSEFVFDDTKLMLNSDILNGLGSRYLRAESLTLPGWDDSRLGGVPTLDALFGDAYHPLVLAQFLMDPARAVGFKFILTIWIAFLSAFTLGRFLTGEWRWGALLGFLYAFNPQYFTHIYGGHDGKMMVFAVAPFALYALMRVLREGSLKHTFYLALSLAWMILTSHLQLTYYFLWGAGFFTLFELFRLPLAGKVRAARMGLAALALATGLLATSFQILPPYLYTTQQSVRGTDEKTGIGHAASWSLHQEELAAMIVPGFIGVDVHAAEPGPQDNRYWGHNAFKLNADSAGALLTFLAFLGLFVRSDRRSALFWFLGGSLALSYALGAHSPLFQLWYAILPGVKSFRAPSMAIFWIPLAMLVMAAPVLKAASAGQIRALKPGFALYLGLVALVLLSRFGWTTMLGPVGALLIIALGITLLAALSLQDAQQEFSFKSLLDSVAKGIPSTSRSFQFLFMLPFVLVALILLSGEKLVTDPATAAYFKGLDLETMNQLSSTVFPGFILVSGVAVAAWFVLTGSLAPTQKALVLALVAAVELYYVDQAFIQTVPRAQYFQPDNGILQAIRQDSPESLQRPRLLSLTRNPALKDNIFPAYGFRNALGFHDNELATYREFRGGTGAENFLRNPQDNAFLNLANVGYILYETSEGMRVLKNSNALGNVALYYNWEVSNKDAVIRSLQVGSTAYRTTLLLEGAPAAPVQPQTTGGSARLLPGSGRDRKLVEVNSSAPAMLFVSENYHPYWKARVNGAPTQVFKAFSTFQAIPIPAGATQVELYYESDAVGLCKPFTIAGWCGIALLGILGFFLSRRKPVLN